MHDPMTVAFEIKSPFKKRRGLKGGLLGEGYHPPIVTIWHQDPEVGGDDDSCGWFAPKSTEADRQWAGEFAKNEWEFWFGERFGSINLRDADNASILAAAWMRARAHDSGGRWKRLKSWEMAEIHSLLSSPGDNFGNWIHAARFPKDGRVDGFEEFLLLVLRAYRKASRPWWKHPRWHLHHWRIQVHGLQRFNRWAFSRCAKCGKRFSWGYAPVAGWNSGGPMFLRGEKGVYHQECSGYTVSVADIGNPVTDPNLLSGIFGFELPGGGIPEGQYVITEVKDAEVEEGP